MLQRSKEHVEANYKCKVVYGDSVTGDTRVLVWESQAKEGSEPTGPRGLAGGRELTVADLFAEYENDDGVDRPQLMVQTHRGYAALRAVVCHRTSKPVYRVTVADGRHVDVTEDHSIAVTVNGSMQFARPMDLVIGTSMIETRPVSSPNDEFLRRKSGALMPQGAPCSAAYVHSLHGTCKVPIFQWSPAGPNGPSEIFVRGA
jgi:hypothetical protein